MHAEFALLHSGTRAGTAELAVSLGSGVLDAEAFGDRMAVLLEDAHTRAVVIGRHHAGDTAPEEADDRRFAELIVDAEAEYLAAFVADIAGGAYATEDGGLDVEAVAARAALYADRLVGTANEAWALTLPEETLFTWELGASDESNCEECPARAEASPYAQGDLPGYPGDNSTPCMFNCRCRLLTDAGEVSFRL